MLTKLVIIYIIFEFNMILTSYYYLFHSNFYSKWLKNKQICIINRVFACQYNIGVWSFFANKINVRLMCILLFVIISMT